MIHSPRFIILLDANVLYPAPLRDLLLNLGDLEIFSPKWSDLIQDEWVRSLLANRKDLDNKKLLRTVRLMNEAFPNANVTGFGELIEQLKLPDQDDRHVLAAAIECNADAILTFNKKDFPKKYLKQFDIEIYDPDKFLNLIKEFNPVLLQEAFDNQLESLKNPPMTRNELIQSIIKCNVKSAKKLFELKK